MARPLHACRGNDTCGDDEGPQGESMGGAQGASMGEGEFQFKIQKQYCADIYKKFLNSC